MCNEGECCLRRPTPHINGCIIIRRLLFLTQNGLKKKRKEKEDLTDSKRAKKVFQKDAALLKMQRYWAAMTEPSNILVQTVNRVARNTQVLRTIKREAVIFQN